MGLGKVSHICKYYSFFLTNQLITFLCMFNLHAHYIDFGCYYHPCFLQGHPRLTILMRRISPGQGKATPNAFEEPDFYAYAKQFPLNPTNEKPLFSPDDEFGDKKEDEVVATNKVLSISQEETEFDALAVENQDNLDSAVPNQKNLDLIDTEWTRVAPICAEDGICPDPSCHGSNANELYSESMALEVDDMVPDEDAPGIPYLQSLLHNLLVYKNENSDSLPQNPVIDSAEDDPFHQMLMSLPELPEPDLDLTQQSLGLSHLNYSPHDSHEVCLAADRGQVNKKK